MFLCVCAFLIKFDSTSPYEEKFQDDNLLIETDFQSFVLLEFLVTRAIRWRIVTLIMVIHTLCGCAQRTRLKCKQKYRNNASYVEDVTKLIRM